MCWDYCEMLVEKSRFMTAFMCDDGICLNGCQEACKFVKDAQDVNDILTTETPINVQHQISEKFQIEREFLPSFSDNIVLKLNSNLDYDTPIINLLLQRKFEMEQQNIPTNDVSDELADELTMKTLNELSKLAQF